MHVTSIEEAARIKRERDAVDANINSLWDSRNALTEQLRALGVSDEPVQFREAAE